MIIGINCRNFDGKGLRNFALARFFRQWLRADRDQSVDTARFDYANALPPNVITVAESGVTAQNCASVFALGFNAILVGTSLLMDRRGVTESLREFEMAIKDAEAGSRNAVTSLRPVTA